jgi:tetratricopeptide (TPR) repeat protein
MSRRPRVAVIALLAGAILLGGCVYYNGMYNTNRLAKSARKAERDGRQFEATSLWGQVITRADSLVERHPRSKYADQAKVLRGLALARLNQCPEAVGPLGNLSLIDRTDDLTEEAALALGRCQIEMGDAAIADLVFARISESTDSARRREARFQRARALRMTGRYEEALALMREAPDPRGWNDLLLALAGTGHSDEAFALADSLLAVHDTTLAWDSVVVTLGRQDPRMASALVGRLQGDPRLTSELRARRLYEDALRLASVDSVSSRARLEETARLPAAGESGERARLQLLRMQLAAARTLDDLAAPGDSLAAMAGRTSGVGAEAGQIGAMVVRLRQLPDSAAPIVPRGDLRLFLGAEAARDSVGSPLLAAALFRRLADDWPVSPYAPKALLAAERLDPTDIDASLARLDSLYADSPYLAIARGEDTPAYQVLEDSLEAYAATQVVAQPAKPGQPRRRLPGVRRPVEPDRPGESLRPGRDVNERAPAPRRRLEP